MTLSYLETSAESNPEEEESRTGKSGSSLTRL
jgi:hypothetical protein